MRSDEISFSNERKTQLRPKLGLWQEMVDVPLEANAKKAARERLTLIRLNGVLSHRQIALPFGAIVINYTSNRSRCRFWHPPSLRLPHCEQRHMRTGFQRVEVISRLRHHANAPTVSNSVNALFDTTRGRGPFSDGFGRSTSIRYSIHVSA